MPAKKTQQQETVCIVVTFPDDFPTKVAGLANKVIPGYDLRLKAKDVPDMVAQIEKEMEQLQRHRGSDTPPKIGRLDLAGHGSPGSAVSRMDSDILNDANNPTTLALECLRGLWAEDSEGMRLLTCNTARHDQGKEFIALLAKVVHASVTAWDDFYEIIPMGKQWTATPDGTVMMTDDTGRTSIWFRFVLGRDD